jgi:NTE family protein
METKNFLSTRFTQSDRTLTAVGSGFGVKFSWIILLGSLLLVGCATTKPKSSKVSKEPITLEQINQPQLPPTSHTPVKEEAPAATSVAAEGVTLPKRPLGKVGLILGAGGIKSFSHIGVIRELEKAQIEIASIVGLEWGSLVGALYAHQGKVNDLEWQMFKLKKNDLPSEVKWNSNSTLDSINDLDSFLRASLESRSLETSKVPFQCPTQNVSNERINWIKSGSATSVLKSCMAYPPLFKADSGQMAAPFALAEGARILRSQGVDTVIFVNLLAHGVGPRSDLLWKELRRTVSAKIPEIDAVVEVPTKGYDLNDLESARQLVLLGQKSAAASLRSLADRFEF